MTNAARQKRYREKSKALRSAGNVTENVTENVTDDPKSVTVVTVQTRNDEQVTLEWDRKKFPNRRAWVVAVERAERARKYAAMFPDRIRPSGEVFQDIGWQYENEGLKAVAA